MCLRIDGIFWLRKALTHLSWSRIWLQLLTSGLPSVSSFTYSHPMGTSCHVLGGILMLRPTWLSLEPRSSRRPPLRRCSRRVPLRLYLIRLLTTTCQLLGQLLLRRRPAKMFPTRPRFGSCISSRIRRIPVRQGQKSGTRLLPFAPVPATVGCEDGGPDPWLCCFCSNAFESRSGDGRPVFRFADVV